MRNRMLLAAAVPVVFSVAALAQSALNLTPSRVVGQPSLNFRSGNPNVVEGREFFNPLAVAVDRSTTPPSLFVADAGNNRVLGWRNAQSFTNGATADLVIGQLDLVSTLALGPGTARSTGLSSPGALAADANGNLYVVDSGNNRILRFPRPFSAPDGIPLPDMVIGQSSFNSNTANAGGISEKSIATATGGRSQTTGLAFDPQGNLWFTDALNNRVLRYPAAALRAGANQPSADLVLGQTSFSTVQQLDSSQTARQNKSQLRSPSGIAVDSEGRVYVADAGNGSAGRVVVYTPALFTGKDASRILGVQPPIQPGQQATINEYGLFGPESIAILANNRVAVADAALNRILVYDAPSTWPEETAERFSPPARDVIGQSGFASIEANRNLPEPSDASLNRPLGLYFSGTELFVADSANNRILVFPQQNSAARASRVLGQTDFNYGAANLVEGKELFVFGGFNDQGLADGGGIALDTRSNPPRLYVADTYNNRVLGYRDARNVRPGAPADIVIGQNDLQRVIPNAPFGRIDSLSSSGLVRPSGLAVDRNGDLFVADSGNGRVLRFPSPFAQNVPPNERRQANLVLGQANFNVEINDPSARNMGYPFGLAFTVDGHLLVSDAGHNRVLYFRRPDNGDFVNGQAAERVIGQPDFFSAARGAESRRMSGPRHIAVDTDDRLYVADAGNNRILVFDRVTAAGNDPNSAYQLAANAPQGIYVSPLTGEIWVANTRANRAIRFPQYTRLAFDQRSDYEIPVATPLALTQDAFGNLYVVEGVNRVGMYFNTLASTVAGNYAQRPLSPSSIAILWAVGSNPRFADRTAAAASVPLPRELADTEVLLDDKAVPLYLVSPSQINFFVPNDAPNTGSGEIQVIRKSTGQIISVASISFDRVSPALFTSNDTGEGQVAAINEDGSVNSPSNPVAKGQIISLYGTGQGFIPNAPPDGEGARQATSASEGPLDVLIGTGFVPREDITYSGLAPGFPGLWQINVRVPQNVDVGRPVPVAVQLRSVPSTIPIPNSTRRLNTTISVKP